jgi:hypothetical protein
LPAEIKLQANLIAHYGWVQILLNLSIQSKGVNDILFFRNYKIYWYTPNPNTRSIRKGSKKIQEPCTSRPRYQSKIIYNERKEHQCPDYILHKLELHPYNKLSIANSKLPKSKFTPNPKKQPATKTEQGTHMKQNVFPRSKLNWDRSTDHPCPTDTQKITRQAINASATWPLNLAINEPNN